MNQLFTIGHSSHSLDRFLGLLDSHSVTVVSDVRSTPYSRRNPQFNREALSAELESRGITYVFLGKELGARSNDPACYVDGQARYELIAKTDQFQEGVNRVIRGSAKHRIAIMCAEADPITCHRTVLVCRSLSAAQLDITHIHSSGRLESHEELTRRLLHMTGFAQGDFFSSRDALGCAYEKQGRKIAYTRPEPSPEHSSPRMERP